MHGMFAGQFGKFEAMLRSNKIQPPQPPIDDIQKSNSRISDKGQDLSGIVRPDFSISEEPSRGESLNESEISVKLPASVSLDSLASYYRGLYKSRLEAVEKERRKWIGSEFQVSPVDSGPGNSRVEAARIAVLEDAAARQVQEAVDAAAQKVATVQAECRAAIVLAEAASKNSIDAATRAINQADQTAAAEIQAIQDAAARAVEHAQADAASHKLAADRRIAEIEEAAAQQVQEAVESAALSAALAKAEMQAAIAAAARSIIEADEKAMSEIQAMQEAAARAVERAQDDATACKVECDRRIAEVEAAAARQVQEAVDSAERSGAAAQVEFQAAIAELEAASKITIGAAARAVDEAHKEASAEIQAMQEVTNRAIERARVDAVASLPHVHHANPIEAAAIALEHAFAEVTAHKQAVQPEAADTKQSRARGGARGKR